MIFEGEKACIGYKTAFAFAGSVFMVDIRGRPLELRSLDTHFDGTGVTALSNFYPMIFGEPKPKAAITRFQCLSNIF